MIKTSEQQEKEKTQDPVFWEGTKGLTQAALQRQHTPAQARVPFRYTKEDSWQSGILYSGKISSINKGETKIFLEHMKAEEIHYQQT